MLRFFIPALLMPLTLLADEATPLKEALRKQAQHKSVVVTFRQTKKVPSLTKPIQTPGKLWLLPGKAFKWQLGNPVKQTIIYNGGDVLVMDEVKKTAKRVSPNDRAVKPLFLTLGMGKEASFEEMSKVFAITGTNQAKGRYLATFAPKPRSIKKIIKSLLMQVNLKTSFIERIGWVQRDGTEAMTEFFTPKINTKVPATTFKVTEANYRWEK